MPVQQHVLNWLYSVLTSEYHDVNRTYNDVAQALAQYPSLTPRTDVHTFANGHSALLLHLSGTLPVVFRQTTYRFPISLWIPHAYPREAPLIYVTPTETMLVRPGQHVDPQGQVYHPYLVGWSEFWDKSTVLDFLAILRDVFAKEPPVISRQQQRPQPTSAQAATPPPVPPLPPDLARQATPNNAHSPAPQSEGGPPPPPPKTSDEGMLQAVHPQVVATQRAAAPAVGPPPLRPMPPGHGHQVIAQQPGPGLQRSGTRYDSAPPLPPQPGRQQQMPAQGQYYQGQAPPGPHHAQYQQSPSQPPPRQQFAPPDPRRVSSISPPNQAAFSAPPNYGWQDGPQPPLNSYPPQQPPQQYMQQQPPPPQPRPRAPPPPNLLDDPEPGSSQAPSGALSAATSAPPPPIPRNPEKDMLLHKLAYALYAQRNAARARNASSLLGLSAQRAAMMFSLARMQGDLAQLAQLSALLGSNAGILRDTIRRADAVVEGSRQRKPPGVDELLVAPTVVANQLYDLVAEERALGDAVFMLGRAVEKGRIAPQVFARMTRALSREWFLKKALVKKIGTGMGLLM